MSSLRIGALAQAAGVHVETVRYYERRGLLDEPPRAPSGYRMYSPSDLWRLQLIGRAKGLGFTLAEIRELLDAAGRPSPDAVLVAAERKMGAVDARRRELDDLRARLEQLVTVCRSGDAGSCASFDVS